MGRFCGRGSLLCLAATASHDPAMNRDRYRGCLLGQALGDALGFAVEGQPAQVCSLQVQALREGRPLRREPFSFGQYTDDTQLARELALSLADCNGFDPVDHARRLAAMFTEHRIVGRGKATENAARRLAAGVPWNEAGEPPPQAGNGSSMRAAPVGLWCHADPRELVRVAVDQGRTTHRDQRASAGAVAIAGAVALALRGEEANGAGRTLDAAAFCRTLAAWVGGVDAGFGEAVAALPRSVAVDPLLALSTIQSSGKDFDDRWPGISPFVVGSVMWSLYAFLREPDDFEAAMVLAIGVGGDVDTTAAMTGAIVGARLGAAALPRKLVRKLQDQGAWRHGDLSKLADRLHAVRGS